MQHVHQIFQKLSRVHHSTALDTYTKITLAASRVKNVSKAKWTEAPLKGPIKSDFSLTTE